MVLSDPLDWSVHLEAAGMQQHAQQAVVQALGCGADVPRALRATGQVWVQ